MRLTNGTSRTLQFENLPDIFCIFTEKIDQYQTHLKVLQRELTNKVKYLINAHNDGIITVDDLMVYKKMVLKFLDKIPDQLDVVDKEQLKKCLS